MQIKNDTFRLDGKTALVTGGGKGIGLAITRHLIHAGATVIITGRTEATLIEACEMLGSKVSYFVNDIADYNSSQKLVETIAGKHKNIDILVNNAGINLKKWATETSAEEFEKIIATNLTGVHVLTSLVLKQWMIPQQSGSVIFIASMASLFGIPQVIAYSSAKSGLIGLMRTLAVEVGQHQIRSNAIAPGWIETDMSARAMASDPKRKEKIINRTPLGRFGTIDDIGLTSVFLASDASSYITGAIIPVDGGVSIGF
ncbi:MAG: glucose 1-dehydrogenase [Paludibacter sp.]|nr:glucose 1-dehydrogenase [Paludibacter sp.]